MTKRYTNAKVEQVVAFFGALKSAFLMGLETEGGGSGTGFSGP